jgi:hypothetical protein
MSSSDAAAAVAIELYAAALNKAAGTSSGAPGGSPPGGGGSRGGGISRQTSDVARQAQLARQSQSSDLSRLTGQSRQAGGLGRHSSGLARDSSGIASFLTAMETGFAPPGAPWRTLLTECDNNFARHAATMHVHGCRHSGSSLRSARLDGALKLQCKPVHGFV